MSYTIPEYVDTRAQAILVLASTVADEDKTGIGNCSVRTALDVLADTLADSDVTIPETDAGEILALAQYVGGGGGGGVTLGPQTPVAYLASTTMPTTSMYAADLSTYYDAQILTVGDVTIADCSENSQSIDSTGGFAAGVTVVSLWMPAYGTAEQDAAHAYLYTLDDDNAITSVTAVPDVQTMETDEYDQKRYTFTVPTVPDGEFFGVCYAGNYD